MRVGGEIGKLRARDIVERTFGDIKFWDSALSLKKGEGRLDNWVNRPQCS